MKTLPRVLEDPSAPFEARLAAVRDLGADDPRVGAFVRIAAGTFLRGTDPPDGEPQEHPLRSARTSAYEMAVVPVTVAEFARFVARGYADRALWSEAGWEWRSRNAVDRPRFWDDPGWNAYLGPNQPVVGVSWFEAEAYARFAEARLPDDDEWERAARGEDGRRYPWGDEWDPARAHHRGGARHTLPVGCFPSGRSPHALWDAAGNVWEWTRDSFDSAQTLRSARGGGWNAHPPQLRCANRNAWPPDARFSNIGFRLSR
jgi:gamma-glutamyl hercynylcysteine S-oxide synthase